MKDNFDHEADAGVMTFAILRVASGTLPRRTLHLAMSYALPDCPVEMIARAHSHARARGAISGFDVVSIVEDNDLARAINTTYFADRARRALAKARRELKRAGLDS